MVARERARSNHTNLRDLHGFTWIFMDLEFTGFTWIMWIFMDLVFVSDPW